MVEQQEVESSRLFYVMGYLRDNCSIAVDDGYDSEWLQLEPLIVDKHPCVEIVFTSKVAYTEAEWQRWFAARYPLHVQIAMLVNEGEDGETCVDRLIDILIETKVGDAALGDDADGDARVLAVKSHVFDTFRIASCGMMHYLDSREWKMTHDNFTDLRCKALYLRRELTQAWQRRYDLAHEIYIARDVMALSEKLVPYRHEAMDSEGITVYSVCSDGTSRMLLNFTPLFDWYDIRVLEDKEADSLAEVDLLTRKLHRVDIVINKQRALSFDVMEGKKRSRADAFL